MSRIKLVLFTLFVAGLSLGIVACGDDSDDSSSDSGGGGETSLDLTIGDFIPLTGDLADFGPPGEKAADLAVDEINAAIEETGADHTVDDRARGRPDERHGRQSRPPASWSATAPAASPARGRRPISIPVARSVSIREGVLQISPASTERRDHRARRRRAHQPDPAAGLVPGPDARGHDRGAARWSRGQDDQHRRSQRLLRRPA